MAKNNPFTDVLKVLENEYAAVADEGTSADVVGFIDTGSYALNALYSGSIFKGMPANKISALAGEEATGKTFFALGIVKNFLDTNEKALSIIFESEGSVTKEILQARDVDTKRVLIVPVETIQQFKTQAIRVVENHLNTPEKDRRPLMLCLDSLGMLSTTKEMNDSGTGKEVKDMTRTAEIKAAFRVLTLKLSKAKIPLLVTNHVYQTMGMFPTKEMGGGGGLKYAANNIIALSKSKNKDSEGNVTGIFIRCKNLKSRLTKENTQASVMLSYDKGLDRYYGLVDLAIEHGIFKKVSTKIEVAEGKTVFEKQITNHPEKFFTEEVLQKIDAAAQKEYCYGSGGIDTEDVVEEMLNDAH
jgi:RecA/RadA recombinase